VEPFRNVAEARLKKEKLMRKTWTRTVRLGLPLVALAAAVCGGASPVASCPTCLAESATAYTYCHNNPTGTYHGCNAGLSDVTCGQDTSSGNAIYRAYCLL
jgi:hypothetical protein